MRAVVPNFPPPGHNAPNTFWIATFSINSKMVMLSIVDHLQAGCQGSGMHHDTLPHDFACPIRLTVIDNNKYLTTDAGMACFYRDNTFATFDAAARTFYVYSVLDGKPAPDCDATIPLTEGATP